MSQKSVSHTHLKRIQRMKKNLVSTPNHGCENQAVWKHTSAESTSPSRPVDWRQHQIP